MNYNMKHIIKIFLATIIVFSLNSCEDSDQVIDQVVADTCLLYTSDAADE